MWETQNDRECFLASLDKNNNSTEDSHHRFVTYWSIGVLTSVMWFLHLLNQISQISKRQKQIFSDFTAFIVLGFLGLHRLSLLPITVPETTATFKPSGVVLALSITPLSYRLYVWELYLSSSQALCCEGPSHPLPSSAVACAVLGPTMLAYSPTSWTTPSHSTHCLIREANNHTLGSQTERQWQNPMKVSEWVLSMPSLDSLSHPTL